MPIDDLDLQKSFVAVDATTTIADVRQRLEDHEGRVDYFVVELPRGGYSVLSRVEVNEAAARLGTAVLDLRLADLPAARARMGSVDQVATSFRRALDLASHQPAGRLVVVREGRPVGLLVNAMRGSTSLGVPLDLFGPLMRGMSREELRPAIESRVPEMICPRCAASFRFYELRADLAAFACPRCHAVLAS